MNDFILRELTENLGFAFIDLVNDFIDNQESYLVKQYNVGINGLCRLMRRFKDAAAGVDLKAALDVDTAFYSGLSGAGQHRYAQGHQWAFHSGGESFANRSFFRASVCFL